MWTLLYNKTYERFEYKDELITFITDNNLQDDKDALIFPPEADDLAFNPNALSEE